MCANVLGIHRRTLRGLPEDYLNVVLSKPYGLKIFVAIGLFVRTINPKIIPVFGSKGNPNLYGGGTLRTLVSHWTSYRIAARCAFGNTSNRHAS